MIIPSPEIKAQAANVAEAGDMPGVHKWLPQ
jgi:hypothetical protein